MSDGTKIEWSDVTWGPAVGRPALTCPISWKKPRKIFINSMGDLFGESVPDEFIDHVFALMALAPQHIFQCLTKKSDRMREYLTTHGEFEPMTAIIDAARAIRPNNLFKMTEWPLPNVWLGISCEDQATADERIPDLLETPAAVRFVSFEPALGPVSFRQCLYPVGEDGIIDTPALNLVIVGGESGPGARPMNPNWARSVRDQCDAACVPFFFKQWGEYDEYGYRAGKARAGRTLDGRTHDDMPGVLR